MKLSKKTYLHILYGLIILSVVIISNQMELNSKYHKWYFVSIPGIDEEKLSYPDAIVPIQKYAYIVKGKTDDRTIPLSSFESPYSVDFKNTDSGEEFTINIVGDIIPHGNIQNTAYMNRDYNSGKFAGYDWLFRKIIGPLKNADITIGNLETDVDDEVEFNGTMKGFNVSSMILGALENAGFDILLTANNHAMDNGVDAYLETIKNVLRYKLIPLGYMNDSNVYFSDSGIKFEKGIIDYKDFKIGVLNYTFFSNKKVDKRSGLNYCPVRHLNIIKNRVKALKHSGAKFVIVFLHWGREYLNSPDLVQKQIAQKLFKSGVDAIIGGHSHFIQPMELITQKNVDGSEKRSFVAYSLGNFISHQRGGCKYGMLLKLVLVKNDKGEISIKQALPSIIKTNTNMQEFVYNQYAYTFSAVESEHTNIEEFVEYTSREQWQRQE